MSLPVLAKASTEPNHERFMPRTDLNIDCNAEAVLDLRIEGNLPHSDPGEPAGEDDE